MGVPAEAEEEAVLLNKPIVAAAAFPNRDPVELLADSVAGMVAAGGEDVEVFWLSELLESCADVVRKKRLLDITEDPNAARGVELLTVPASAAVVEAEAEVEAEVEAEREKPAPEPNTVLLNTDLGVEGLTMGADCEVGNEKEEMEDEDDE